MDFAISTEEFSSSSSSAQAFSFSNHTKPFHHPLLSSVLFISYKANIMGVITYSQEFTSVIPPSRMFKALFLDSQEIMPNIVPKGVKSIEFKDGDGELLSIEQINFGKSSHIKYIKHKLDALDAGSFYCKYTMIESDIKFDKIDSVVEEVKLVAAGSGCVCKMTSEYHVQEGCELKEEDIKKGKDRAMGLYKAIEEYLVANPDVCA